MTKKIEKRPSKYLDRIIYWLLGIIVPIVLCSVAYSSTDCSNPPSYIYLTLISLTVIAEKYVLKNKLEEKIFKLIILNVLLIFYWVSVSFFFAPRCPSVNILQKEASNLLTSNIKASQVFFIENGKLADSTKDLGEYISVSGCKTNDSLICRNSASENYSDLEIKRSQSSY